MNPPKERMCHCTGFTKSCRDLVVSEACGRWTHVQGCHPQTGAPMDYYACVDDTIPVLLMSIGKMAAAGTAATESFRNEVVARQDQNMAFDTLLIPNRRAG